MIRMIPMGNGHKCKKFRLESCLVGEQVDGRSRTGLPWGGEQEQPAGCERAEYVKSHIQLRNRFFHKGGTGLKEQSYCFSCSSGRRDGWVGGGLCSGTKDHCYELWKKGFLLLVCNRPVKTELLDKNRKGRPVFCEFFQDPAEKLQSLKRCPHTTPPTAAPPRLLLRPPSKPPTTPPPSAP